MIDLSIFDLLEPKAKDTSCGVRDGGVTFVYHKNGKRIVFSKRVLHLLGDPDRVQFGFIEGYLVISSGKNEDGFSLKDMNKSRVIYNAPLIKEILNFFKIPYDERFCKTFSEIEEIEGMKNAVALKMQG